MRCIYVNIRFCILIITLFQITAHVQCSNNNQINVPYSNVPCNISQDYQYTYQFNDDTQQCGRGVCAHFQGKNVCECNSEWISLNSSSPCSQTYAAQLGDDYIAWVATSIVVHVLIGVIHSISVVAYLLSPNRVVYGSMLDPGLVTSLSLAAGSYVHAAWVACDAAYQLRLMDNANVAPIVYNLGEVLVQQGFAAILFFWYATVSCVSIDRMHRILSKRFLLYTFCGLIAWWLLGSVGVTLYPNYYFNGAAQVIQLIYLVAMVGALFYYGIKILMIISPRSRGGSRVVKKLAAILIILGLLFIGDMILQFHDSESPSITLANWMAHQWVYLVFLIAMNCMMLLVFSAGDIQVIWQTFLWLLREGRLSDESPLALARKRVNKEMKEEPRQRSHLPPGTSNTVTIELESSGVTSADSSQEERVDRTLGKTDYTSQGDSFTQD